MYLSHCLCRSFNDRICITCQSVHKKLCRTVLSCPAFHIEESTLELRRVCACNTYKSHLFDSAACLQALAKKAEAAEKRANDARKKSAEETRARLLKLVRLQRVRLPQRLCMLQYVIGQYSEKE